MHYGLTRYLAGQAGFEKIDAEIIANETVGVDLHDAAGPTANAAAWNWAIVYEFHFPIAASGKVEEGVSAGVNPKAWTKVNTAKDLVDLVACK